MNLLLNLLDSGTIDAFPRYTSIDPRVMFNTDLTKEPNPEILNSILDKGANLDISELYPNHPGDPESSASKIFTAMKDMLDFGEFLVNETDFGVFDELNLYPNVFDSEKLKLWSNPRWWLKQTTRPDMSYSKLKTLLKRKGCIVPRNLNFDTSPILYRNRYIKIEIRPDSTMVYISAPRNEVMLYEFYQGAPLWFNKAVCYSAPLTEFLSPEFNHKHYF